MKKMSYPAKEPMLVIRPCLKAICYDNSAAGKLLSVLLYWYDHSNDECPDGVFTVYRTQEQLASDAIDELSTRTIHDICIPYLIALGYLDVVEGRKGNYYTLYIEKITEALTAYNHRNPQILPSLIRKNIANEYEKFRIIDDDLNTKNFEFNTKNFEKEFEEFRNVIRKISNSKRGRKPSTEAAGKPKTKSTEIIEITRDYKREVRKGIRTRKPKQEKLIPDNSGIALSEEEQRIHGYWCEVHANGFPVKPSSTMKAHWNQLASGIKSVEEMKSLYDYVSGLPFLQGKAIAPGNLTNKYPDWLSLQRKPSNTNTSRQNGHKPENNPEHESVESLGKVLRVTQTVRDRRIKRGDDTTDTDRQIAELEAKIAALSPQTQTA